MRDLEPDQQNRVIRPMSPCVSICTLDDDLVCMGCRRTLEEIRNWAKFTGAEQWALVKELAQRQKGRTSGR